MTAISKPSMEVKNGIYKFTWDDLKIHATLDRIISEGKTLSGELKLTNDKPEGGRLVEQTRLNLLSDMKRNQLAKTLTERNAEIDWLNVLKFICVMTVDDVRKGEPVQYLGGQPETMEQEFTLFPLLEKNEPTTIFADGGTGKSYLADYIAVLVHYSCPGFVIPFTGPLLPSCVNVLYLDWEATKRDHERRVWAIKAGMDFKFQDGDFFFYRRCFQPLVDDIPEIQKIITEKNIGFIIIDSQVAASDGEQDKADGARRYYNALRALNVTSLTLDHVTKGNGQNGQSSKPYGSTFKWNLSRSQFELKKCQETGSNKIQLALYHRKHNEGTLLKPIGYEIEWVYKGNLLDKVVLRATNVADTPQLAEALPTHEQIKSVLTQPLELDQIAELLPSIHRDVIKTTLNRYKTLFIKSGPKWGLIYNSS